MNVNKSVLREFAEKQKIDLDKASAKVSSFRENLKDEFVGEEYVSRSESIQKGKELRKEVPLEALGEWTVERDRTKPNELLEAQDAARIQELIPLRHERMSVSPFTFYRGAAAVMAYDLSKLPTTGITVQAVGDAHIANFGVFASPERRLVFDINDFDETLPGPWEWDVLRLMTSIEICGRDRGFSKRKRQNAVRQAAETYRTAMRRFSRMGSLDVWYAHLDVESMLDRNEMNLDPAELHEIRKFTEKALGKNSSSAMRKLTETVDGKLRIKSDPPVIVPIRDLDSRAENEEQVQDFIERLLKLSTAGRRMKTRCRTSSKGC